MGVIVFFAVVASSFNHVFGSGGTTVVEPSAAAGASNGTLGKPATQAATGENSYPIGFTIKSGAGSVVVNSVTLAGTDAVLAANQFNKPPAAGSQYIIVNYSATYIGNDSKGQAPAFLSIEYVTASGNTVNALDKLAVAPQPIDTMGTVSAGRKVSRFVG